MEKFLGRRELVSLAVAEPEVKPSKSAFLSEKVVEGKQGWEEYVVKKKFLPNGRKHGKQYEKKVKKLLTIGQTKICVTVGFSASFRDGVPHGKFWLKMKEYSVLVCVSGIFSRGKLEELEVRTGGMETVRILYEDGVPGMCSFGDSSPFRMYDKEKNLFYTSEGSEPLSKLRTSSPWGEYVSPGYVSSSYCRDDFVSFEAHSSNNRKAEFRKHIVHELLLLLSRKFSVVYGGLYVSDKSSLFGVIGKDKEGKKYKILVPFSAEYKFPEKPRRFK